METQPNSAHLAWAILSAWQSGDLPRFRWQVDAAAASAAPASDTSEMERFELLRGVASELCGVTEPFADPEMQVCRDLLRHLASC